jgi:hypothetical protein
MGEQTGETKEGNKDLKEEAIESKTESSDEKNPDYVDGESEMTEVSEEINKNV